MFLAASTHASTHAPPFLRGALVLSDDVSYNQRVLEETYFNTLVFPGLEGHNAQHVPGTKDDSGVNWMGGNGQQMQAVDGYGPNTASAWANNNCNTAQGSMSVLADLEGVSLADADPSAWLQQVYPPHPAPFAAASVNLGPNVAPGFGPPGFGPPGFGPPGLLGGEFPATADQQGIQQYPDPVGPGCSPDGALSGFQGAQLLDGGASFILPQAVYYQDPAPAPAPAPPVPSAASSPCGGDPSSAGSLADVSDMSDLATQSPAASDSEDSAAPAAAVAARGGGRRSRAAKGKAPHPGLRSARSRTRLPSGAPRSSPARRPSPPPVPWAESLTGAPYSRIQDMDAASKAVLEAVLLQDRDPERPVQVPYKIIMAKLRLLFAGAEETLRGHYRRLTKSLDERVRKPVWQPDDIRLLKEAVPRCRRASKKSINWTAVSKYIHDNGGSYRFGITTCSKMRGKIRVDSD